MGVKGRFGRGDRRFVRTEKEGCYQGDRQPRSYRRRGGEEPRHLRHPRLGQDQDSQEASDQGGQEDDVRKGGPREGAASEDGGEGLRRGSAEEEFLRTCSLSSRMAWSSVGIPRNGAECRVTGLSGLGIV